MAASLNTQVWAITPLAGVNVGLVGSTPAFRTLTAINCSNGRLWNYLKASMTIGSVATVKIGASGSASTDSGSAGWTANAPGGAVVGQYFWARKTSI